jgi:hypothetical protein
MLDNGNSVAVEGCKVTLLVTERSFKSIFGMVELVHGIVPMGSAQTAEFEWVSPRGVVIRPFCITILYYNLLLFIDIFHI